MEWKEVKIADLCSIKHGYAYKGQYFCDEPTPNILVTPGNFTLSGGFKLDKPKYYNGPIVEDYILHEGDIIVTMTDLSKNIDTLGYSALVPKIEGLAFHHNQRIGLVENVSDEVDRTFLYWIMRTPHYQKYVANHCSGSTVHHTSPSSIASYTFKLPDLATQRRISSILSSLDRKIELNNKINATLEEMAQALFKSWFVDFEPFKNGNFIDTEIGKIPEGWRLGTLSEVAENITDGVHNTVIDDPDGECLLLSAKNIKNGVLCISPKERRISKDTFQKLRKRTRLGKGDVLITTVGTIGEILYLHQDLKNIEFQRSVGIIKPLRIEFSYFIFLLLKSQIHKVKHMAHGAVQQCIFIGDLKAYEIIVPSVESLIKFSRKVEAIFTRISNNSQETLTLTHLRDTLLPRLMSGEIEV